MATAHGGRLFLFEAMLLSALLLLLLHARPASAADGSTYPADCPYPCLPPPAAPAVVTANCPPPPPSSSYNTPPSSSWSYPPPPPPSGGYIPYLNPPAGGGAGYGYPAPPPPNPILPWYPWYYKTPPPPPSAAARGTGSSVLGLAAVLAAGQLIVA